jgi:mannose-6-phosphate isomerase
LPEPVGEAWLTGGECKIAAGPYKGKTLGEAWRNFPVEWRGTQLAGGADFPLLVKFIFPKDKLSIQVHPDDAYASVHEQAAGGRGKTEMWHAVSAEPGAQVLVGLKPGVTMEKFRAAIGAANMEDLFQPIAVNAGDTFYLPAGTPHTIGPNMVLCEVQQYCDLTYRVYDYGRVDSHGKPRELHIEKALDVMNFGPSRGGKTSPAVMRESSPRRTLLAAGPFFATERWESLESFGTEVDPSRLDLIVILAGEGTLSWRDGAVSYLPGQCWLLPADLGRVSFEPNGASTLMRTHVPDLPALQRELKSKNVCTDKVLFS